MVSSLNSQPSTLNCAPRAPQRHRSLRSLGDPAVATPAATTSTLPSVLIRPRPVARCELANGSLAPTLTRSAGARGNSTADGAIRPACIPLRASVPPPFRCVPVLPGRNAPRPGLGGLVPRPPAPQTGAAGVAAFSGSTVTPLSSGSTPAPRSIPAVRLSPTARPSGSQRSAPQTNSSGRDGAARNCFQKENRHGAAPTRQSKRPGLRSRPARQRAGGSLRPRLIRRQA